METKSLNKRSRALFIVLPIIMLVCLFLWYLRNFYREEFAPMIRVQAVDGVYDLSDIDFSAEFVRLEGDFKYIPAILTPEEFVRREDEAAVGEIWKESAATSRAVIRVPEDGFYMIAGSSIDFAHRAYINGELRFQAGVPAVTEEDFVPGAGWMRAEAQAADGEIELVQQSANFVHREGGGHGNLYFGKSGIISRFSALTLLPEAVTAGLFAALFLVHLVLYVMRRSYRPNLIFSVLCLTWMVRTGFTGAKVFCILFPALPWQAAFRAEYLSLPIASALLVLLAWEVFPGVPQKWFVRTVGAVSAVFSVSCLTADTVLMSWLVMGFEGFFTLAILYLCVRFAMKIPGMIRTGSLGTGQAVSFAGFFFFMAAGINDAMYHLNIPWYLGFSTFAMTGLAMLIFSFFQMTAMFYGTMQEAALAHERERRAEAENEMLVEMNRLKSAFYTDMSHEMKTPLTVIAVNAQFAAQNMELGVVDEETVTDLNAISAEARRLAQMVTSLVGLGRMQDSGGLVSVTSLLTETTRIYQALFARKGNTLTAEVAPDLPMVTGNADQLIQVLINLLSNANRHTNGGTVSIRAEAFEGRVKVSVADSGEGIAPDLLPHVFERFCHGENGGSGLGLPICRAIIEEHGGEIYIESEDGRGTKVWFTLPVREETDDGGD